MTDQELKDLVASFAVDRKETGKLIDQLAKEAAVMRKEAAEEAAARRREAAEETAARRKEDAARRKEIDKQMQETDRIVRKTSETVSKVSKQMGGIDDNIGFHAEQYFQEILREKLTFGGQKYDRMIANMECSDKKGISLIEFDIVLINGKSIAIIETKHRIHHDFVKKLVEERLPMFREFFPGFSKHKAYLGIAGFSFSQKVLEEAKKYGIGIIRQVGESIEIEANNLKVY